MMVKSVTIRQVATCSLACEPILRRTANGELLCVCECDGPSEPHIENRVYAFHSGDNGATWSSKEKVYPEDGNAVACTEVAVLGDEITAYCSVHSGKFYLWNCAAMKSVDNGYTWENVGTPPHFSEYALLRAAIRTADGNIVFPYQCYPITIDNRAEVLKNPRLPEMRVEDTHAPYCETGVLVSRDNGKTYERYMASRMENDEFWVFSEPTVVELPDGRLVILMRRDGSGCFWRTESRDGGKTWSETVATDIISPSNKPKLIRMGNKVALAHTPSPDRRYPFALWISDDNMETWRYKTVLTEFPGSYNYADGFYENGHLYLTIEHNRHTILFFDVELDENAV